MRVLRSSIDDPHNTITRIVDFYERLLETY